MSNIEEYTKNFKFIIPEFNVATWHTEIKENFKAIDALIANFVQSQQYKGAWKQVTQYEVGDLVYISDEDSNNYGGLFKVLVDHITTADDFDTFLGNNPTYYDLQGEMGAQVAALRAQDWAEKTDGIVVINESPVDYSSKAYAIGGVGTETNNAKYFKEQAESARDTILQDPGFIAVSADLVGDENIKTVADNILNVNNVGDNILSILAVYNNLSDINVCVSNINAIVDAPNQATNAQNSAISAAQSAQLAQEAALSITGFDLFDHKWEDHLLNDQNWLRADTFSWQDGTVYTEAYNHLDSEWTQWWDNHTIADIESDTVNGVTVYYATMPDGHKICHVDEVTAGRLQDMYAACGVAWYYVIDRDNQRFKLPRENPAREELIQTIRAKGNGLTIGVSDSTYNYGLAVEQSNSWGVLPYTTAFGAAYGVAHGEGNIPSNVTLGITTDSTKSGIISSMADSTSVYKGKKYLYFYVGQFSQSATEQTAGLNSELFNGKMDRDMSNMNPSQTAKETIVGWIIPDLTTGVSQSNSGFTSAKKQWLRAVCSSAGYDAIVKVNGDAVIETHIGGTTAYMVYSYGWYLLDVGDVVTTTIGSSSAVYLTTYDMKGL